MNVGERIRILRQRKNITVNKLANLAGISQSYLRDIELGNKQPTVEYLSYICDALEISLANFFDEGFSHTLPFEIASLSNEQLKILSEFIKSIKI